jgi:hypothetical protein
MSLCYLKRSTEFFFTIMFSSENNLEQKETSKFITQAMVNSHIEQNPVFYKLS